MLVLYPNEQILLQREAKISIRVKLGRGKIEGKGIFYITNMRVVFEDYKQGILTQFALNEMHGYRKVKGLLSEKLSIDYQRTNSSDVLLAELEFKSVDDAYKLLNTLSNTATVVSNDVTMTNYKMMNNKSNNQIDELDGAPAWVRPWISDIKFTWNPATRGKELGLISDGSKRAWHYFDLYVSRIERNFKLATGTIDTSKFADDFKYKVAREAYKIRATFPYERYYTYDSNKYWIGMIEHAYKDSSDELIGININADSGSGYFIYSPEFWYHKFLSVVGSDYDYERDRPFIHIDEEDSERFRTKIKLLAESAKKFYFAVLNKDFMTAEIAYREISETYKKYDTDSFWLSTIGEYGLLLKYAIEMDKRNIPIPTPTETKRSPI